MAFTAVLLFVACFALPDMGAKMPPASLWRAYKRRNVRGGYRDTGGRAGAVGGYEKARHGLTNGGRWWYQDFFAVSQITINGSSRINKMIKRGLPPPR